ncbi:MAG TPA: HDOD domain-containing protein [Bryobacteraceae bacterium]|nr:HDOD domain-containing protein [Bryobacteraceae bacterium]
MPPASPQKAPVPGSAKADFHSDLVAVPAKLCSLPPLNSIANRVLALSDDPDSDSRTMASVVEGDPAFAAEVLFLANSPLFGFPSKLQALPHAVSVLGDDRIKALATTVAMRAFVGGGGPLIRQCWRHSAACAAIAEQISPAFAAPADQAYSTALMHDIGRLGLVKCYPQQIGPVLGGEHAEAREALFAERAVMKIDHQQAGAWLVKHWALPDPFQEICQHHHDRLQPDDAPLLQVVKTACRLSDALGFSAVACRSTPTYSELMSALPAGVRKGRIPAEEHLREQVEERLASFEP